MSGEWNDLGRTLVVYISFSEGVFQCWMERIGIGLTGKESILTGKEWVLTGKEIAIVSNILRTTPNSNLLNPVLRKRKLVLRKPHEAYNPNHDALTL